MPAPLVTLDARLAAACDDAQPAWPPALAWTAIPATLKSMSAAVYAYFFYFGFKAEGRART
jgi:hypothetical protein